MQGQRGMSSLQVVTMSFVAISVVGAGIYLATGKQSNSSTESGSGIPNSTSQATPAGENEAPVIKTDAQIRGIAEAYLNGATIASVTLDQTGKPVYRVTLSDGRILSLDAYMGALVGVSSVTQGSGSNSVTRGGDDDSGEDDDD